MRHSRDSRRRCARPRVSAKEGLHKVLVVYTPPVSRLKLKFTARLRLRMVPDLPWRAVRGGGLPASEASLSVVETLGAGIASLILHQGQCDDKGAATPYFAHSLYAAAVQCDQFFDDV